MTARYPLWLLLSEERDWSSTIQGVPSRLSHKYSLPALAGRLATYDGSIPCREATHLDRASSGKPPREDHPLLVGSAKPKRRRLQYAYLDP